MFYTVSDMKKMLKKYHNYTSEDLKGMNENKIKAIFLQKRQTMMGIIHESNPSNYKVSELKQLDYVELLTLYNSVIGKTNSEVPETLLTMEDVKDIYPEETACLTEEELQLFLKKNNIKIIPVERVYTEAELETMYPGIVSESNQASLLYFLSTNNIRMIKDGMTPERLQSYLNREENPTPGDEDPEHKLKFKP